MNENRPPSLPRPAQHYPTLLEQHRRRQEAKAAAARFWLATTALGTALAVLLILWISTRAEESGVRSPESGITSPSNSTHGEAVIPRRLPFAPAGAAAATECGATTADQTRAGADDQTLPQAFGIRDGFDKSSSVWVCAEWREGSGPATAALPFSYFPTDLRSRWAWWSEQQCVANTLRCECDLTVEEAQASAALLWRGANDAAVWAEAEGRGHCGPRHWVDRRELLWVGACLSVPEASGRAGEMAGGYRSLLQIGALHQPTLRALGLSWDDEQDLVFYGLLKIAKRRAEGQSLQRALTPWAQTRGRALRLYARLQDKGLAPVRDEGRGMRDEEDGR